MWWVPGVAFAEPTASISSVHLVITQPCSQPLFDEVELRSTLHIELLDTGTNLLGREGDGRRADTGLVVVDIPACDRPEVYVLAHFPGTGRSLGQDYDLSGQTAAERARNLAIAIAELLYGMLSQSSRPTAPPEPAPPGSRGLEDRMIGISVPVSSERPRRWSVHAQTGILAFPLVSGMLYGWQLGGAVRPSRSLPLRIAFDASYRFEEDDSDLGRISSRCLTGEVALALTGEAGSCLRVGWDLGLRLTLGWAWVRGEPGDPEQVTGSEDGGFITIGSLQGSLRVGYRGPVWVVLDTQVGYVLTGIEIEAGDERVGGIGKLSIGVGVGLEIEL